MSAIIHTTLASATYKVLKSPVVSSDPAGFDTASMDVLFRGTQSQFDAAFPLGALNMPDAAGGLMYCLGPLGATQARFGFIWGTVGWKGFKDGQKPLVESYTAASRDVEFPRQVGSTTVWLANPAGKTGAAFQQRRARASEMLAGVQQSGVSIGQPGLPVAPVKPKLSAPKWLNAFGGRTSLQWGTVPGALINDSHGWVCRNFQTTSEFTLGAVCLRFWTAQWEYVPEYSP